MVGFCPAVDAAVTEDNFQKEVLDSSLPVSVDFWAPWCGPCRMIAPLIDELAAEYSGKLKAVKLNTDEAPGIATKYGIRRYIYWTRRLIYTPSLGGALTMISFASGNFLPCALYLDSIPTVMVFKDGKKVDCIIGAVPKSTLTNTIEKYVD